MSAPEHNPDNLTPEQLFSGLKGPGRGKPIAPFKYPLPPEIEAKIGDEKPTVHLIAGANGECLCGTDLQTCAEIVGRMLSAPEQALPATGDAARIAELERQLAEARANERAEAVVTDAMLTDLRAQLAASEKDKARIDWFDSVSSIIISVFPPSQPGEYWEVNDGSGRYTGDTLRAAIDAAMKEAR